MNIEQARFNMIQQQVRPWNVLDEHVLELLETVKREDFCPEAYRNLAFSDLEVPMANGSVMLAPRVQARLVQDAQLDGSEQVLLIGAGTGFMAALLARSADHVVAYEIDPATAEVAKANLHNAGIDNVQVHKGDGFANIGAHGQFDAIVLGGSVTEIPEMLKEHLALGGRLVAVVGEEPMMYTTVVTRESAAEFTTTTPWDVNIERLQKAPVVKVAPTL